MSDINLRKLLATEVKIRDTSFRDKISYFIRYAMYRTGTDYPPDIAHIYVDSQDLYFTVHKGAILCLVISLENPVSVELYEINCVYNLLEILKNAQELDGK